MSYKKKQLSNTKFKLINSLFKKGKKNIGEKILLHSFKLLQKETKKNTTCLLKSALINDSPIVTVKNVNVVRRQSKKISIPIFLNKKERIFFSIKSLITVASIDKKGTTKCSNLKESILRASIDTNQKENKKSYQLAHSNYSVSHYRWF